MVCWDGFEDDAVGLKQLQCVHLKFAKVIIAAKQKQSEWNKFGRDEVEGDEKDNTEDERLIHQNGAQETCPSGLLFGNPLVNYCQ